MTELELQHLVNSSLASAIEQVNAHTKAQRAWHQNPREAIAEFDAESEAKAAPSHSPSASVSPCDQLIENAVLLIEHGELEPAKSLLRQSLNLNPYATSAIKWLGDCLR